MDWKASCPTRFANGSSASRSPHDSRAGDFDGGLTAGVQSIIAATKGEYKGTGTTTADRRASHGSGSPLFSLGFVVLIIIIIIFTRGSGMFLPWLLLSSSGSSRSWGGGGFSSGGGSSGGGFGWWRWIFRGRWQFRRWWRGRELVTSMHPKTFSKHLHHDSIVAAIRDAERKTSGEIRVSISPKHIDDPVAAAQAEFMQPGHGQIPGPKRRIDFCGPPVAQVCRHWR